MTALVWPSWKVKYLDSYDLLRCKEFIKSINDLDTINVGGHMISVQFLKEIFDEQEFMPPSVFTSCIKILEQRYKAKYETYPSKTPRLSVVTLERSAEIRAAPIRNKQALLLSKQKGSDFESRYWFEKMNIFEDLDQLIIPYHGGTRPTTKQPDSDWDLAVIDFRIRTIEVFCPINSLRRWQAVYTRVEKLLQHKHAARYDGSALPKEWFSAPLPKSKDDVAASVQAGYLVDCGFYLLEYVALLLEGKRPDNRNWRSNSPLSRRRI
ncbi:hypothetical protein FRC03_011061 [Tulasnella sp. 419]|nr:hypothetical protein FRC03_011061 [Tulasnella sp. 419]